MSISAQIIQKYGITLGLVREGIYGTDARGAVYGATIPLSNGKRKIAGAPIWASPIRDFTRDNPDPAVLQQMFTEYHIRDFAVAFGYNLAPEADHGPPSVLRMWINSELYYDASDPTVNGKYPGLTWTLYPGDSVQVTDPTIYGNQGSLTPAYRPMIYIVFKDWELPTRGLAPAFVYALPVIEVEFADGLTISNVETDFTMLPDSTLTAQNVEADWEKGQLYSITGGNGANAVLHTFDTATRVELSAQAIGGSAYTSLNGYNVSLAFDNKLGRIVVMGDGVSNNDPLYCINTTTGQITGKFGHTSSQTAPIDVDGNPARGSLKPIASLPWGSASDICYVKAGAGLQAVAVIGGTFKDLDLVPINAAGAFPATIPLAADKRYSGSGNVTVVKRVPLAEEKNNSTGFQDAAVLVGVDNRVFCEFFGLRNGQPTFLGSQLVHTFTGRLVIDIAVDPAGKSVVIFTVNTGITNYKATAFQMVRGPIAPGTSDPVTGGAWQGYFPAINQAFASGPAPLPADTPLYDVSVPDMAFANVNRNAMKMGYPDGTVIWPSGSTFTVFNLSSAKVTTIVPPTTFTDFIWDGRTRSIYHQNTLTAAMAVTEVNAAETEPKTIGQYLRFLALRAGYADVDIVVDAALTDPVLGMLLVKTYDASGLFTDLSKLYDFFYFESGGKIHFTKVGRGVDVPGASFDLNILDLAKLSESGLTENDNLLTTIEPPAQQTAALTLNYIDSDRGYKPGTQTYTLDKQTADTKATAIQSITVPVVMGTAEAYSRVTKVSIAAAENDVIQEFRLPQRYMRLEPSDLVSVTKAPYQYIIRLEEVTFNGDWSMSLAGKNFAFSDNLVIPDEPNLGIQDDGHGFGDNSSQPVALDIPLINRLLYPADSLMVVQTGVESYGQRGFTGAVLMEGPADGLLAPRGFMADGVKFGVVIGALPDNPSPWCTDYATALTIAMRDGDSDLFESASYADYVAGRNAVLVGSGTSWELIYFKDVEVINPKVVKLTGLARGRRGTDPVIGLHSVAETAILVSSVVADFLINGLTPQAFEIAGDLNSVVRFSTSAANTSRDPVVLSVTLTGASAKPFSVSQVTMTDAGANDRLIEWLRRDRIGGEFIVIDQPMSESTERYDLEILDGSTIVRTVAALTVPSYTYSAADQATDGFSPPLDSLKVRIYQLSATVGRGFIKEETPNVE